MQDVLKCTTQHADPTGLAFVERTIERRDDLSNLIQKLARNRHSGMSYGWCIRKNRVNI